MCKMMMMRTAALGTALVASVAALQPPSPSISRKDFVQTIATAVGAVATTELVLDPFAASAAEVASSSSSSSNFLAYRIIPDASAKLDPILEQVNEAKFFESMVSSISASKSGAALWLGEHHNSERDHAFQNHFVRSIHAQRPSSAPMAIGLEQVQLQFQTYLDDYVDGKISIEEMKEKVQWESRWMWSFANYLPIFETAKELGIRLLALNVDSEDLSLVEKNGYPGLKSKIAKYIRDPVGFGEFATTRKFSTYVDYVISPSYEIHQQLGLLRYTIAGEKMDEEMPFRNFLSGRILWDECMAGTAARWTVDNPGGLLIGLVGADHIKFSGGGIPGRYERMTKGDKDSIAVVINPTLIDSRPSGSVAGIEDSDSSKYPDRITLQLRYVKEGVDRTSEARFLPENTGGVLGFADYIVIS